MSAPLLSCAAIAAMGMAALNVSAQVSELGAPFEGDYSEGMESYPLVFAQPEFDIFFTNPPVPVDPHGRVVAVESVVSGFAGSTIGGSTTSPRTGSVFGHVTDGVADFVFDEPVQCFGGYFTSNSGGVGGTAMFFDNDDQLLDTLPLNITFQAPNAPWIFNGWEFESTVTRIRLAANPGQFVSFLQFDDLEVKFVPNAGTGGVAICALVGLTRRRRRAHC